MRLNVVVSRESTLRVEFTASILLRFAIGQRSSDRRCDHKYIYAHRSVNDNNSFAKLLVSFRHETAPLRSKYSEWEIETERERVGDIFPASEFLIL